MFPKSLQSPRLPGSARAARFFPNQLPSLAAWYRHGVGITSAANAVSQWDDASGNARHLLQATGAAQPALQGDNSILFDGTSDYMAVAFTLPQPCTMYALMKPTAYSTGNFQVYFGGGTGVNLGARQAVNELYVFAGSLVASAAAPSAGAYHAIAAVWNGASSGWSADAGTFNTGNAGVGVPGGVTMGAASDGTVFGGVTFKELICFSAAHDAATRAKVVAYLARVGGLSI